MTISSTALENPLGCGPVIACVDSSDRSSEVARIAASYARVLGRPLILFHVIEASRSPSDLPDPLDWRLRRQEARRVLGRLRDDLSELPGEISLELNEGDWLGALIDRSGKEGTLLVIGASHAGEALRSADRAVRLLTDAGIASLLLVPPGYAPRGIGAPRIAVPVDGSNFAEAALAEAAHIAHLCKAELLLLHAVPDAALSDFGPPASADVELRRQLDRRNEQAACEFLERTQRRLVDQGIPVRSQCLKGDPRAKLLGMLEEEAPDLVILAARGQGERHCHDLSLGSTASYLVDHLSSPVMLLRSGTRPSPREHLLSPERRQPGTNPLSLDAA